MRAIVFILFATLNSTALAALETRSKLLDLAKRAFAPQELTEAEQKLFLATEKGEPASMLSGDKNDDPANAMAWPRSRVIRAEYIRWLCTNREASALITHRGIRIGGMRIDGDLQLEEAQLGFSILARNCAFRGNILLSGARIRSLYLLNCSVKSLLAATTQIEGDVFLRDNFRATGEINLWAAKIGGALDCQSAQLTNPKGTALNAEETRISGSVFLGNGFQSKGTVNFTNAAIGGNLNCDAAELSNPEGLALIADRINVTGNVLLRNGFKAQGEVSFLGGTIGAHLQGEGAHLSNPKGTALDADGVRINGSVFLRNGFRCEGEVNLVVAKIEGTLECDGAQLTNPNGRALNADSAQIKGAVFLRNRFKSTGEVNLLRANIHGNLDCDGDAEFINPEGKALSADGAQINGNVFLTRRFKSEGQVNLLGAKIDGALECDGGAQLINPGGKALNADSVKITGSVFMRNGFKSEGEVNFLSAQIDGNLDCDNGAQLVNPGGKALNADAVKITGSVFMRNGFQSEGEVNFLGAKIGGTLDCNGAHLTNPTGYALELDMVKIAGGLYLNNARTDGGVGLVDSEVKGYFIWSNLLAKNTWFDLRSAKVAILLDDEPGWPLEGRLFLDGFTYDRIGESAPLTAESRLRWLRRQPRDKFLPQPYEQLAAVLRAMGHEEAARAVMIGKNQDHAAFTKRFSQEWWWYNVVGSKIGYGYQPWNAFWGSLLMVVLGWVFFRMGFACGLILPLDEKGFAKNAAGEIMLEKDRPAFSEHYSKFNAFIYSLESFTPLLRLDQSSNWAPNAHRGKCLHLGRFTFLTTGSLLRIYLWIHIIAGWVLTTLWVGGITGLVKS